jgi:hypothetical protein
MKGLLTDSERDQLLIRLDERTCVCAEEIKQARAEMGDTRDRLDTHEGLIAANTTSIKWLRSLGSFIAAALAALIGINWSID